MLKTSHRDKKHAYKNMFNKKKKEEDEKSSAKKNKKKKKYR